MYTVTLGGTGITVNRNGFGALPIQRDSFAVSQDILRRAYEGGINFFDTARFYTNSEQKLGNALHDVRDEVVLATKTGATTIEGFWKDLEASLRLLQTDHIDIYQFHNIAYCPKPDDGTGMYEAMLKAKAQGKIRHIGITNHRLNVATEAVESGLYETLQYPFSYLAGARDVALVQLCAEKNVGFIAMKALSGGLITRADAAYAYIAQYPNVLPIWGVQRMNELEEFLHFADAPPVMNDEMDAVIEHDRKSLGGEFCRGCGYCMPCPQDIDIAGCNRMALFLQRAPVKEYTTPAWQEKMNKIEDCIECGTCVAHCPYELQIPDLLKKNLAYFRDFIGKR